MFTENLYLEWMEIRCDLLESKTDYQELNSVEATIDMIIMPNQLIRTVRVSS